MRKPTSAHGRRTGGEMPKGGVEPADPSPSGAAHKAELDGDESAEGCQTHARHERARQRSLAQPAVHGGIAEGVHRRGDGRKLGRIVRKVDINVISKRKK